MSPLRALNAISGILVAATVSSAATPKEIDAAVQKGTTFLKEHYKGAKPGQIAGRGNGLGAAALSGLALLESGMPADDPTVKAITAGVRDAAFAETQTYHIALGLLYLDRLGESADVPIIQMLGVRLLAGQNSRGGWTYSCIDPVAPGEERLLRTSLMTAELKAGGNAPAPKPAPGKSAPKAGAFGKLHADVEKYAGRLAANRIWEHGDDNSNTQFALLGIWAARKYDVPVEHALDLIEKRFLATQNRSGGWPYGGAGEGSPSMTCAGLLGLATAIGRREERRLMADHVRKDDLFARPTPKEPAKPIVKSDDPFYNPPTNPKSDDPFFNPAKPANPPDKKNIEPKKGGPKVPADPRDAAIQYGLASLGAVLTGNAPQGRRKGARIIIGDGALGDRDYYFLWSLERVGVVFGLDKIGGIDWYDLGAEELVRNQNANGSWGKGGGGSEVDTAFALLFLARSNLVRDLSAKVQKSAGNTELRAGAGPAVLEPDPPPMPMAATPTPVKPAPVTPAPTTSAPTSDDPKAIAAELLAAADTDWNTALNQVRDRKGTAYTQALLLAIPKLEVGRLKSAREALAERLTRMTAETLRAMVKERDVELRRGAALAMAMKDDKALLPDLIAALLDEEDIVVRAAKAGLKSIAEQDFGPAAGATLAERTAAAKAWLEWLRKQK